MLKQTIRRFLKPNGTPLKPGEQPPNFYDEMYANSEEYRKPFWQSRYYFLWTVIVDRLRQSGAEQLLEIGCGSGQFAQLLYRDLPIGYTGLDISEEGVAQARSKGLGDFRFEAGDALQSPLMNGEYDSVVCMEVLEHIERDRELIERIQPGARCLCTVPNFPYKSHVRHFLSDQEVHERYGDLFDRMSVWGLAGSHRAGVTYFLLDGIKN